MNKSFFTSGDDVPQADKAEILLQHYFESCITEREAEELADFWDKNPEFDLFALKNHEIDQLFKFFGRLGNQPIVAASGKSIVLHPVDSPFPRHDVSHPLHALHELDFDSLVRLAEESKALSLLQKDEATRRTKSRATRHSVSQTGLPTPKAGTKENFRASRLLLLLAFLVAIPVLFYNFHESSLPTETEDPFLARVVSVVEPVYAENSPIFKRNQAINNDTIHLLSGKLELELKNKVRIVLEGEAIFSIQTALKTSCQKGRISVEVPKGIENFEVLTPLMKVRDLGTEFVVDVTDSENAVHVIRGKVEASLLPEHRRVVAAGSGVVATTRNSLEPIPARKSLYVDRTSMRREAAEYEARCFAQAGVSTSRRLLDPEMLVYLDFDDSSASPFGLKSGKGGNGVVGCRKTIGRWENKAAAAFSSAEDRILVSALESSRSFTLFASARLNNFDNETNVLFSVGDVGKGAIHWQINQRGEIRLLIGEREWGSQTDYSSPPVIRQEEWNTWMSFAVVVDAWNGLVTHYVDGRKVASLPLKSSTRIDFSRAEIGNWMRRENTPVKRFFNGRIDEFFLLGRAAGPEEIQSRSTPF